MSGKYTVAGFLAMLILLGGLSGCGENKNTVSDLPDDPKARWLQGEPCASPCWENIWPETNPSEAIELLKSSPIVDSPSVHLEERKNEGIGVIAWAFTSDSSPWSGRFAYPLSASIIEAISLTVPDLCLDEIIGAYGEPDYLYLLAYKIIGVVDLIWQSHGFIYEKKLSSPDESISENICGGTIVQFSVGTPFQKIPSVNFMAAAEEDFVPWTGYGNYNSK